MIPTRALFHRTPMIRFLGKRSVPRKVDHTPKAHPASPTHSLPNSFAAYRQKALQHGPLNDKLLPLGYIGTHSGKSLGSVEPDKGEAWDRDDLPSRFGRLEWSRAEIEAIESGGASLYSP